MYDENIVSRQDGANEKYGIFVKRILAKYFAPESQLLFQEKRDPATGLQMGVKEPLKLYINNAGENGEHPVQGITEIIMNLNETPSNIIISNTKSRIKIIFKVFLLIKYQDLGTPSLIVLPDDIGTKCMSQYDLSEAQHKSHNQPKETLQISDGNFMYIVDVPLTEFDSQLTPYQLNDSTLQSYVVLKNLTWTVDVDDIEKKGAGIPPSAATVTTISVFQDLLNKIGIDDDIVINGVSSAY
ncbi:hypothetical protein DFR58_1284 [Anaerobacterium chartisolvens]|uniref:Uncharacterized protein n=1 Tax=Anaerobacterium chartisolvens TaxID=1297424 RepID=A0A369AN58_9FIRM|nr:hypothetical protein [Anaerobacterium chartisolvens]RCX10505.1 hypothetical protein DFR58_1284 [Anaerobacterium chartisolvens]